ncbi:MAG: type II toxin-antitoxin system prevent-host-death family antitoxin [Armatimonadota bacterium]
MFDLRGGDMMLDLRQVFTLTDFLRNHKEMVARLNENHKPVVLTVKGRPALVIQEADSYQDLLDRLRKAESKEQ